MDTAFLLRKVEEELKLRGYSGKTVISYKALIKKFLETQSKPADMRGERDMKDYILSLMDRGYSRETIRLTIAAVKFFYRAVLEKEIIFKNIPLPKREKKLPNVLSYEDITSMIEVTTNKKHKILIMLAYSSGLRVSELVKVKTSDLDLEDLTVLVRQGKGRKDRISIFAESLKRIIVQYLSERQEENLYLFPGRKGHIHIKTVQKVLEQASKKARLHKKVSPHMLRHSFATHLLEQGTDIRYIQSLLGHRRLETTQIYTRVARTKLKNIKNPLDRKERN